ncbi:hypothetical protein [Streptomyces sp. NPDC057696]|uniref:hypothetical protein n=1 Tax=Streptomyces sp. NPDC057696 TaxID=3346218 RepID=UPI0036A75635
MHAEHASDLNDLYDFLDKIRPRPEMWVPEGSVLHFESILTGYRTALNAHGVDEDWPFWSLGSQRLFAEWLWQRLGRHTHDRRDDADDERAEHRATEHGGLAPAAGDGVRAVHAAGRTGSCSGSLLFVLFMVAAVLANCWVR